MKVVGIGGRSGSGKTTVCRELAASDPERFQILSLDNYQKPVTDPGLPRINGMINWDDPSIMLWQKLRDDITTLRAGRKVHTHIWARRSVAGVKEPAVLEPREIIIVEGYLALYAAVAGLCDQTFFFDQDRDIAYVRRRQARGADDTESVQDTYRTLILDPMHELHVEPTKATADVVIDVRDKSVQELVAILRNKML